MVTPKASSLHADHRKSLCERSTCVFALDKADWIFPGQPSILSSATTRVILQGRVREHTMTAGLAWRGGTCGVLLLSISNFLAQKRVDFVTRRGVSISHPRRHCFSFTYPTNCSASNFSSYFSILSVAYSKFSHNGVPTRDARRG
jgi:hypothetical protein